MSAEVAPGDLTAPDRSITDSIAALRARIETVIRGKSGVVELALVTVVAGGHILLEDVPGVGKTTLAHTLARALLAEMDG